MAVTFEQGSERSIGAQQSIGNRWLIAIMGTVLQMCLGTVYAWSFFGKRFLVYYPEWSKSQTTWAFSIAICCLGISAAVGGIIIRKVGPKRLAMIGGALFGIGYLVGALALHVKSLGLLYLGYGVIGGVGLGLGYVTPVATVAKWFPDKKGLITGMVVMGFGLGAFFMSTLLGPSLEAWTGHRFDLVFGLMGVTFLILTLPVASFLRNPPEGYVPPGYSPAVPVGSKLGTLEKSLSAWQCVFSLKFLMMWLLFFFNIAAGVAIVSSQGSLIQDLLKRVNINLSGKELEHGGDILIAISSLFNGAGRFFWGGLSDRIGRVQAFRFMLLTQILAFFGLMLAPNPYLFGVLVCYVLLCYGGGFGTMPSFVLDVFGQRMMPIVYGAILTAWAAGGVVGPQLFAAISDFFKGKNAAAGIALLPEWLRNGPISALFQNGPGAAYSFMIAAGFLLLGLVASLALSNKPLGSSSNAD